MKSLLSKQLSDKFHVNKTDLANNTLTSIGLIVIAVIFGIALAYIAVNYSPLFAMLALVSIPMIGILARRPEIGLILVVALIPFENINILTISSFSLFELFTLFTYAIAVIYSLVFRKDGKLVRSKINWVLFLFLLTVILSNLVAYDHARSIKSTLRLLRNVSLYIFVINLIRTEKSFYPVLWVLVLSGTLSALYGLYAYFFDHSLLDPTDLVLRVRGTMNDPNEFAGAMIVRMMIAVGLFRAVSKRNQKVFLLVVILILAYSIFLSGSRGGILGLSAAVLAYTLTSRAKARWLIVGSLIIIAGITLMPLTLKERIGLVETSANVGNNLNRRITYLYLGKEIIKENPILGVGIDGFASTYAQSEYRFLSSSSSGRIAHNTYLEIATGGGLLGLTVFLIMLGYAYVKVWKISRINTGSKLARVAGGLFAGLTGFFVVAFFLSQQYEKTLWLLLGLVVIIEKLSERNASIVYMPNTRIPKV